MIITEERSDVETCGVESRREFRIAANPKAFDLLSSNIYTHKVRAVIRELSCNAYDAHVDAGVESPFYVHLPTELEPFFSVRDYGKGLSEEDMYDVYTGYFVSTKTGSNAFIGALGLGSKSPFCLVDSFVVVSYHNGKKTTYTCYRGEDRTPQISRMSQEDTTESGIEVVVTIERRSTEFQNEAVNVFKYFDRLPAININGVITRIEEQKKRFTLTGDGFGFTHSYGNLVALMGNVAYAVPSEMNKMDLEGYIRFDIGELSFDPGRENLSLDSKTKDAVSARISAIRSVIKSQIEKDLEAITKPWDRYIRYNEIAHGPLRRVCEGMREYLPPRTKTTMERYSRYYGKVEQDKVSTPIFKDVVYIWKTNGLQRRIKSYVSDKSHNNCVILITPEQAIEIDIDPTIVKDGKEFLPKVAGSSGTRVKFDCYVWTGRTGNSKINPSWEKVTIDDDEERVYVVVDRLEVVGNNLYTIKETMNFIGSKTKVYGLTRKFIESDKFDSDQWIKFDDFARSELQSTVPSVHYEFTDGYRAEFVASIAKYCNIPELNTFAKTYSIFKGQSSIYNWYFKIPVDKSLTGMYKKVLDLYPIVGIISGSGASEAKIVAKVLEKLNGSSKNSEEEECPSGDTSESSDG